MRVEIPLRKILGQKCMNLRDPSRETKYRVTTVKRMDEALKESERLFRTIFENVEVGILVADKESRKFLMGNRWIQEALGYGPDEIGDLWLRDIHPGKDLPHIIDQFGKLLHNEITVAADIPVKRKDGSIFYADISALPVTLMNRTLWAGIFRDVSDRRQAEKRLKDAETWHHALFEGANDAILVEKDNRLINCNQMALNIYGFDKKEDILTSVPSKLSPRIQPDGSESEMKALEIFHAVMEGKPQRFYWKHVRRDGTPFDAEVSLSRIDLGDEVLVQGIVRDITERVQAEEALRKSEEKYRRIVDAASEGIWMLDADLQTIFVNARLTEITGYPMEEIIGRRFEHFLFDEDLPDHETKIEARKRGLPGMYERRIRHKDGRAVWTLVSATPLLDSEQRFQGSFAMLTDITERKQAEDELREKSQFIASLLHAIPVAVFYKDSSGRYLGCNEAFTEFMGVTSEQIRGKTVYDLWPVDLAEKYHRMDLELMRNREHQVYEFQVKARDGRTHPVIYAKDVYPDKDGEVAGLIGAFLDITDLKRSEAERARLTAILESTSDLVGISYPDGKGMYMNAAGRRMAGFGADEDLSRYFSYEVHPAWARRIVEEVGMPAAMAQGVWEGENAIVNRRDGREIPVSQVIMVHRLAGGEIDCISTIIRDISERKMAEKALKDNMAILAEAERIGNIGSWKRDLTTNRTFWSAEARRIFGFSEDEEFLYECYKGIIHPDDFDELMIKIRESENMGTPFEAEYRIMHPDGTLRYIYDKGEVTLGAEGRPAIIHGFSMDITERKRLEDNLIKAQRLDSIGTLAGGIAHDYNNLLTVIMGNIDLAKMDIARTDKAYSQLSEAEKAAKTARDLTQQIITFSGGGYPKSRIMQVGDLMVQSVGLALSGSNIEVEWRVAADLPEVKIDENQIRLAIQNIVINAREAMPQGGKLRIREDNIFLEPGNTLSLAPGTYVRLSFRDEGPGIPAENLPKVFDPYFTTKDLGARKGLGLGLSICYSIIRRHKGLITVDSEEDAGTTVTIHIPSAATHIEM